MNWKINNNSNYKKILDNAKEEKRAALEKFFAENAEETAEYQQTAGVPLAPRFGPVLHAPAFCVFPATTLRER